MYLFDLIFRKSVLYSTYTQELVIRQCLAKIQFCPAKSHVSPETNSGQQKLLTIS